MKKYFVKYIPVEGETKPLDSSREWLPRDLSMDGDGQHWIVKFDNGGEYFQLAKLFLCTREFEVGDNIYDNRGRLWENCEWCWYKAIKEGYDDSHVYY